VVWVMGTFYLKGDINPQPQVGQPTLEPSLTPTPEPVAEVVPVAAGGVFQTGITRLAQPHTILPSRPRFDVAIYEVKQGDTLFAIAEQFGLHPETLLWGNYYTLADDPHRLSPGIKLNILPVDGVYYEWHAGDGINGVAKFYGVSPDAILDWPGNHLDKNKLGDPTNPNIPPGTWLIIPGGRREFVTWSAPRITRENPAVAKIFGPGACGKIGDGPVGIGTFIWPTTEKFLSGYDFSPETNHWGIDIAGNLGNAIYAADNGVVVYAGWNDWGYGNVVVIDHGNGWQTLYAHLSVIGVDCGAYVYQGGLIGNMGSTGRSSGPHLHFEMLSDTYGRANPWNFLQK
jgi:murein DD-endopeptidase MepM/ murein hydrolase activator NlpD